MEDAHKVTYPTWSTLPPLVIERIYSFLNCEDQFRMSQVCRNWRNEIDSPNLWRRMKICLPVVAKPTNPLEVYFARKYGHWFEHVEIICEPFRTSLIAIIHEQLKAFLQSLTYHSRPTSVAFRNLRKYFRKLNDEDFADIFHVIINFLSNLNNLKSFEFQKSGFSKYEAADLIQKVFEKNCKTLKKLHLGGFTHVSTMDAIVRISMDMPITINALINLQTLTINYSFLFEDMFQSCFEYGNNELFSCKGKGRLEKIELSCIDHYRVEYAGIQHEAWLFFKEVCPEMKIDLTYWGGYPNTNKIEVFIVPHMPIRSLNFIWDREGIYLRYIDDIDGIDDINDIQISFVFHHLINCRTNILLEELKIEWLDIALNLASDLINFLQLCPKLKVLQLLIQHPVINLGNVFDYWLQNSRISLKTVHVTITNALTRYDQNSYFNLSNYYAPLLQELGLELRIIVDD